MHASSASPKPAVEINAGRRREKTDLRWSATLATGESTIDAHNQNLICALNDSFNSDTRCEAGAHFCQKIERTIRFLVRGLAREEATMTASAYPYRRRHKEEHRALLVELQAMKHAYACGGYDQHEVLASLSGWVAHHIEVWDKPLAAHLRATSPSGQQTSEQDGNRGPRVADGEPS